MGIQHTRFSRGFLAYLPLYTIYNLDLILGLYSFYGLVTFIVLTFNAFSIRTVDREQIRWILLLTNYLGNILLVVHIVSYTIQRLLEWQFILVVSNIGLES